MKFNKLGLAGALCAVGLLGNTSALAADNATVEVSATVVGTCKFTTKTGAVAFTLDPSVGGDVTGTITQPVFWCTKGVTYAIADDNGLNESGTTQRMKNTAGEFIPYSFTYTASGTGAGAKPGSAITMNIASSVMEADYLNASADSYTDTVTLTINP